MVWQTYKCLPESTQNCLFCALNAVSLVPTHCYSWCFFETQQLQAGSHLTNKWNHLCRCRDFDLAFCRLGSDLYYYEYWIYRTLSYRGGRITTAFLSPRASLARFVNDEQIRTCIKRTQIKERISSGLSSLFTVFFSDVLPTMRAPFSDT